MKFSLTKVNKTHLLLFTFLLAVAPHAHAAGWDATGVRSSLETTAGSLVGMCINIGELIFEGFMAVNVLIGMALEQRGHKSTMTDMLMGYGLLLVPSIINATIKVIMTDSSKLGTLWF